MAQERIGMRKIKEILRMGFDSGISKNKIARCCKIGRKTVQIYFHRFEASGLKWPLPDNMSDEDLERKLFSEHKVKSSARELLNYEYLCQEIKKPNVTLALLWEEYKQDYPDGYQYSQFCELFRRYRKTLNYSMRQDHKAGEKTFVDFGEGLKLVDPRTGELIPTKLFVSVWGASTLTFAKASLGEDISNWIDVNVSALEYYGCCPKAIVPDNLKSAVSKACRYEPEINPTYAEFASHHGVVIFPARPYRPKDKPKAENGVKLTKRWILAKLRNRIFCSLTQMNAAIRELLEIFNNKQMKRLKKSRRELFEILDKPNALPLPPEKYVFAEWKKVKVNIDYHVCFDDHYYSVPYTFIHQELEIRATRGIIEIFKKGQRICSHQRSYCKFQHTTQVEHMPRAHQKHLEWTPARILAWAEKCGPSVKKLVERIIQSRKFSEQAYRCCLGLFRLGAKFSDERLEKACRRALEYHIESYRGVNNILLKNLDRIDIKEKNEQKIFVLHENIRGAGYYEKEKVSNLAPSQEAALNRVTETSFDEDKSKINPKQELERV